MDRIGDCLSAVGEVEKGVEADVRTAGMNVRFVRVGLMVWVIIHCSWDICVEKSKGPP